MEESPLHRVVVYKSVLDSLMSYSKMAYPEEGILLLRGKSRRGTVEITNVVVPPAAVHARSYSSFNWWMIPIDFSYLGVAHSHPSGNVNPSHQDLLHATGRIMVIMGYPFAGESSLGIFDHNGNRLPIEIRSDSPHAKIEQKRESSALKWLTYGGIAVGFALLASGTLIERYSPSSPGPTIAESILGVGVLLLTLSFLTYLLSGTKPV